MNEDKVLAAQKKNKQIFTEFSHKRNKNTEK